MCAQTTKILSSNNCVCGTLEEGEQNKTSTQARFFAAPFRFCGPVSMPLRYVRISPTEMRIVSNTQVFVRSVYIWCHGAVLQSLPAPSPQHGARCPPFLFASQRLGSVPKTTVVFDETSHCAVTFGIIQHTGTNKWGLIRTLMAFHYAGWLIGIGDRYNGLLKSLCNWVVKSPQHPDQPGFFHCSNGLLNPMSFSPFNQFTDSQHHINDVSLWGGVGRRIFEGTLQP